MNVRENMETKICRDLSSVRVPVSGAQFDSRRSFGGALVRKVGFLVAVLLCSLVVASQVRAQSSCFAGACGSDQRNA